MRNPLGVRIFSCDVFGARTVPSTHRRYYCQFCWSTIIQRAKETYPQLVAPSKTQQEKQAYSQQMGVLLGYRTSRPEFVGDVGTCRPADIVVMLPQAAIVGGVPLGGFFPTGDELKEHIKEAHRILTPVGWE